MHCVTHQAASSWAKGTYAQSRTQCRSDPYAEQILTKYRLPDGNHPAAGKRLFEIAQTHKVGRRPIAALKYSLADLGVAGFIRDPQPVCHQWK